MLRRELRTYFTAGRFQSGIIRQTGHCKSYNCKGVYPVMRGLTILFSNFLLATFVKNSTTEVAFIQLPTINSSWLVNRNLTMKLYCSATYPVELVTNFKTWPFESGKSRHRVQSLGDFTHMYRSPDSDYIARSSKDDYIHIAGSNPQVERLEEEQIFTCRAIANHTDNIRFTMTPHTEGEMDLVHLETVRHAPVIDSHDEWPEWPCKVEFRVRKEGDIYYWTCTSKFVEGDQRQLFFARCPTAAHCANVERYSKASAACVTVVPNSESRRTKETWTAMDWVDGRMNGVSGAAICPIRHQGQLVLLRAVEFFYEMSSLPGEGVSSAMRFSQPDIPMQNLMWMEPAPRSTTYYTREVLVTSCCIPSYGFTVFGEVLVTLNGTQVGSLGGDFDTSDVPSRVGSNFIHYWQKHVSIDIRSLGPGSYVVHCIAPVWNTTERVSHNRTIEVRHQKPMLFVSGNTTSVEWSTGEANKTLNCDATGDPDPLTFSWKPHNVTGTYQSGSLLHVPGVSSTLPGLITCTATNQFGENVTKEFRLDVKQPSAVIPITISVTAAALVFLALILVSISLWRRAKRAENLLSDEEVEEFFNGYVPVQPEDTPPAELSSLTSGVPEEDGIEMDEIGHVEEDEEGRPLHPNDIQLNPRFEIKKRKNIIVDPKSKLGKGAFGVVCKGHIKLNDRDRNPTPVAIKQVPGNLDNHTRRVYLKALMSELKILAYIGQHPNIAKLVGAYWQNIQKGVLYVGIEFCKCSLLDLLRDNRKLMENSTRGSARMSFADTPNENMISVSDMIRWASEIAAGMEFLSRKRVVHGDLAARNVLLTFDLNAKVCDFGLARQLVNTVYIKTPNCELPWRWMAIESLRDMEFSTRSDVWAYGVTLWELFALGDTPYPTSEWTDDGDFLYTLVDGMRLPKPEFASDEVYEVMRNCWNGEPRSRPKFSDLKQLFKSQLGPEVEDTNDQ